MTQSIENAIPEIATVVIAVSGIKGTGGEPRENASEYPFAMTYLLSSDIAMDINGSIVELHNIAIDLLVPREWDLGDSLPALHPILDDLKVALFTEIMTAGTGFFNNSIDTFNGLHIDFLPEYPYVAIDLIGYRLVMEQVKMVTNL